MSNYSLDTLRWGMAQCYDRDVAAGREPFERVNRFFWSRTSGLPIELVEQTMSEVIADRSTRAPVNGSDDEVIGK